MEEEKIVKLTGEPVSEQMRNVLKRLSKGQEVSQEEIEDTIEMRIARTNVTHAVDTSMLENRELLRHNVFRKLWEMGAATVDEDGNTQYNGYIEHEKRLDIVIGLPACGKSSAIVDSLSEEFHSRVIDNDEAKKMIPQYNDGWGAGVVHKESQQISDRLFLQSVFSSENIILPKVGADADKLVKQYIEIAKASNYEVNVHFVDLDRNKALGRMLNRFIEDGRFLDPNLIETYAPLNQKNRVTKAYEELKNSPLVDGFSMWDNDVNRGERPILLEHENLIGNFIDTARTEREDNNYGERENYSTIDGRDNGRSGQGIYQGNGLRQGTHGGNEEHDLGRTMENTRQGERILTDDFSKAYIQFLVETLGEDGEWIAQNDLEENNPDHMKQRLNEMLNVIGGEDSSFVTNEILETVNRLNRQIDGYDFSMTEVENRKITDSLFEELRTESQNNTLRKDTIITRIKQHLESDFGIVTEEDFFKLYPGEVPNFKIKLSGSDELTPIYSIEKREDGLFYKYIDIPLPDQSLEEVLDDNAVLFNEDTIRSYYEPFSSEDIVAISCNNEDIELVSSELKISSIESIMSNINLLKERFVQETGEDISDWRIGQISDDDLNDMLASGQTQELESAISELREAGISSGLDTLRLNTLDSIRSMEETALVHSQEIDGLKWNVVHEMDDDNGNPMEWATKINESFIWIDKTDNGFEIHDTPNSTDRPLETFSSLDEAKEWVTEEYSSDMDMSEHILIDNTECVKVDEWKTSMGMIVLGNDISDPTEKDFYLAQIGTVNAEFYGKPTREEVEDFFINELGQRELDMREAGLNNEEIKDVLKSQIETDSIKQDFARDNDGKRNQEISEDMVHDEKPIKEKSFDEQVDEVLAGKFPFYSTLKVCDTPDILLEIGCEQLPMLYTQKHLKNVIQPIDEKEHKHGLKIEQIKSLPIMLANPAMIMDSPNRSDSVIVVSSDLDSNNNPILVSIRPNGKGRYEVENVDSNFITSVYGRNHFDRFLKRVMDEDKLLYCSKSKSQELFERWGEQYSELTNNLDFDKIIHQSNNIVKNNFISNELLEKSFAEQVDEVLNGTFERYSDLKVCNTPDILKKIGCEQLPVFYTQKHLRDALKPKGNKGESIHHHGLKIEQIKAIPELLSNPVMVYDSLSRNDSIVIVTSETDQDIKPIVAVIRPNGQAKYEMELVDSNFMLSVHGRENFDNQIKRALEQDKILYCDKQKSQELFSVLGLQLSQGFNNLDFDKIIHQSNNIVKNNFPEKPDGLLILQAINAPDNKDNVLVQQGITDLSQIETKDMTAMKKELLSFDIAYNNAGGQMPLNEVNDCIMTNNTENLYVYIQNEFSNPEVMRSLAHDSAVYIEDMAYDGKLDIDEQRKCIVTSLDMDRFPEPMDTRLNYVLNTYGGKDVADDIMLVTTVGATPLSHVEVAADNDGFKFRDDDSGLVYVFNGYDIAEVVCDKEVDFTIKNDTLKEPICYNDDLSISDLSGENGQGLLLRYSNEKQGYDLALWCDDDGQGRFAFADAGALDSFLANASDGDIFVMGQISSQYEKRNLLEVATHIAEECIGEPFENGDYQVIYLSDTISDISIPENTPVKLPVQAEIHANGETHTVYFMDEVAAERFTEKHLENIGGDDVSVDIGVRSMSDSELDKIMETVIDNYAYGTDDHGYVSFEFDRDWQSVTAIKYDHELAPVAKENVTFVDRESFAVETANFSPLPFMEKHMENQAFSNIKSVSWVNTEQFMHDVSEHEKNVREAVDKFDSVEQEKGKYNVVFRDANRMILTEDSIDSIDDFNEYLAPMVGTFEVMESEKLIVKGDIDDNMRDIIAEAISDDTDSISFDEEREALELDRPISEQEIAYAVSEILYAHSDKDISLDEIEADILLQIEMAQGNPDRLDTIIDRLDKIYEDDRPTLEESVKIYSCEEWLNSLKDETQTREIESREQAKPLKAENSFQSVGDILKACLSQEESDIEIATLLRRQGKADDFIQSVQLMSHCEPDMAIQMADVGTVGTQEIFLQKGFPQQNDIVTKQQHPLNKVEELLEGNYNQIDGVINNLPPKEDRKTLRESVEQKKGVIRRSQSAHEENKQITEKNTNNYIQEL